MRIAHPAFRRPRPSFRAATGFTLIELLTVIAIIGILAAIIIPTTAKVRESATRASCASNLRQLALGTISYANDNRGKLPQRTFSGSGGVYLFPHAFVPSDWNRFSAYVGNPPKDQLMFCPGPLKNWRNPESPNYAATGTGANYTTYSCYENIPLQAAVISGFGLPSSGVLKRLDEVPDRFFLWTCLTCFAGGAFHGHADEDNGTAMVKGQNAARGDGSVRWVQGTDLIRYHAGANSVDSYGPAAL